MTSAGKTVAFQTAGQKKKPGKNRAFLALQFRFCPPSQKAANRSWRMLAFGEVSPWVEMRKG